MNNAVNNKNFFGKFCDYSGVVNPSSDEFAPPAISQAITNGNSY